VLGKLVNPTLLGSVDPRFDFGTPDIKNRFQRNGNRGTGAKILSPAVLIYSFLSPFCVVVAREPLELSAEVRFLQRGL
jgi:hypothetical protein